MRISHDLRDAASVEVREAEAVAVEMRRRSEEFIAGGSEIYH